MKINIEKIHVPRWMWSKVKAKANVHSTSTIPQLHKVQLHKVGKGEEIPCRSLNKSSSNDGTRWT
jgi:hypothetical protein